MSQSHKDPSMSLGFLLMTGTKLRFLFKTSVSVGSFCWSTNETRQIFGILLIGAVVTGLSNRQGFGFAAEVSWESDRWPPEIRV